MKEKIATVTVLLVVVSLALPGCGGSYTWLHRTKTGQLKEITESAGLHQSQMETCDINESLKGGRKRENCTTSAGPSTAQVVAGKATEGAFGIFTAKALPKAGETIIEGSLAIARSRSRAGASVTKGGKKK